MAFLTVLPRDCTDIWNLIGTVLSGVYTVYTGSNYRPLTVYCDMNTTSGGWTVSETRRLHYELWQIKKTLDEALNDHN